MHPTDLHAGNSPEDLLFLGITVLNVFLCTLRSATGQQIQKPDEAGGVFQCSAWALDHTLMLEDLGDYLASSFNCRSMSEQLVAKGSKVMWSAVRPA